MKRFAMPTLVLLATAAIVGCEDSQPPTDPGSVAPQLGKGGGTVDTRPRANIVWSDSPHGLVPGIEGDSRSKVGSTTGTLDEYQGDFCGVSARLFALAGETGDLNADFDTYYTSTMFSACGTARRQTFHLGGTLGNVVFAPHFVVRGLTHLAVGQSRSQYMGFGIQQTECQRVMFDSQYSGASDARITRIDDGTTSPRQWRVESQSPHTAQCVKSTKNGTLYAVGSPIYLPFSFTVTEVPYPYPTYP